MSRKKSPGGKNKLRAPAIFLASQNEIYRTCVVEILRKRFPRFTVKEIKEAHHLSPTVIKHSPDLVLYDISLSGYSWPLALQDVVSHDGGLRLMVLNTGTDDTAAWRALRAGAWGYVSAKDTVEGLVHGVERVIAGKKYISPHLLAEVAYYVAEHEGQFPHEKLSAREYEVLCRIGSGKSVSHVAREMTLSMKTVSTFRARILEKMNLRSNEEIIRYVLTHGLAP